jgi:uncharacterized protein (TIGR03435 family)
MRLLAGITLFALTRGGAFAQDDSAIAFEAATIKAFPTGAPIRMSGCQGGPGSDNPGRIECEYVTLKMLLMRAYKVKSQEIFGPGLLESEHFNIVAKLPQGATRTQVPMMFRNLLAERFKLTLHHEDREMPVFSLMVAKGGLKIKLSSPAPTDADDPAPAGGKLPIGPDGFPILRRSSFAGGSVILYRDGRARLQAGNTQLSSLAETFSGQLERVVVDETGMTGAYDITLYWTPDPSEPGGRRRSAGEAGSTVEERTPDVDLRAAVEQQLGLTLVSKKIARDALVIDHAEKVPTQN